MGDLRESLFQPRAKEYAGISLITPLPMAQTVGVLTAKGHPEITWATQDLCRLSALAVSHMLLLPGQTVAL